MISDLLYTISEWLDKNRRLLLCHIFGHPGVVWYNCGGLEPDMHCKRCGEDLG